MNRKTILALLATSVVLGACAGAPESGRPLAPVAAQWPDGASTDGQRAAHALGWRAYFVDTHLQTLIAAALEHNRDLRIAVARIEEARAQLGIARAERYPAANLNAGRSDVSTPADLSQSGRALTSHRNDLALGMTAFELDFWGRVRNTADAAQAGYLATVAARQAVGLSLIADVASAYLSLVEMEERTALAKETLTSREESRRLIVKRREVGIATELDSLLADGAVAAARAEFAALERQRLAAGNALTLLVGKTPETSFGGRSLAQQALVADLTPGIPSEVLLLRPDVVAAEQRLHATRANLAAARTAFLPRIALTASLGVASRALSGLFDAGSGAWTFQPSLGLPLFDWGRVQDGIDLAAAREVVAVAEYEKTLQQAFREIADLLAARTWLAEQLTAQEIAAKTQAERSVLAEARYRAGVASYLDVLDAQRELNGAKQSAIQTRRALLATATQLYKALGGGLRE